MAAQAIAGMVAMTASVWIGYSTYAKKKPASIGINAGQLVMAATKSLDGMARVIGFSGSVQASQFLLTQQT